MSDPSNPLRGLRYVYHYCIKFETSTSIKTIDGIVHCVHEISSMEDYRQLKKDIVGGDATNWSITSLTPLGRHLVEIKPEK